MSLRHPVERGGEGRRGWFAHFSEVASNLTSSPAFFGFCLLLVAAFIAVHAAGLDLSAQHVVGEAMTAVTLVLLALLKNAERRAEHAIQRKLDAIAAALLEQSAGTQAQAHDDLRRAIRMEDEL